MKKLLCKFVGHVWSYKPKPDMLSSRRVCVRCGIEQKRTKWEILHNPLRTEEVWETKETRI
jgi:hypothetical protein